MIEGYFRIASGREIRGWVTNLSEFIPSLSVVIYRNGEVVGRTLADMPRPDLKERAVPNISCGFLFVRDVDFIVPSDSIEVKAELPNGSFVSLNPTEKRLARSRVAPGVSPVFITGSPRSGTSALVNVMLAAGYKGYREGNYLSLVESVFKNVDNLYDTFGGDNRNVMINNIDKVRLKESLLKEIVRPVIELNGTDPWFDKTGNPAMIRILPHIMTIWPDCKVLFAKRRAFENISSRVKKFPGHSFEFHCRDWADNLKAWRQIREVLPADRIMEVDQQDMIRQPAVQARRISGFLGLSADQETIIELTFSKDRPQQTAPGSTERVLDLDSCGWSETDIKTFHSHCDVEMRAYGYSYDKSYYL